MCVCVFHVGHSRPCGLWKHDNCQGNQSPSRRVRWGLSVTWLSLSLSLCEAKHDALSYESLA